MNTALNIMWNSTMKIGVAICALSIFATFMLIIICFMKMEFTIRSKVARKFAIFSNPFLIYREYSKNIKNGRLTFLIKKSILIAPFVFALGLLILIIGASFLK